MAGVVVFTTKCTSDEYAGPYYWQTPFARQPEARRAFYRRGVCQHSWFKLLFPNRLMMNHTVTFSGGDKDNSLYASLGYLHDGGWSIMDKVQRVTAVMFYIS